MIQDSARISLGLQFLTTCIDIWGLQLPVDPKYAILKQLLQLEVVVQIIEFVFYVWLLRNFKRIDNITPFRYLDWMITTPAMLIQLMAFLSYDVFIDTKTFLRAHAKEVSAVLLLNWIMMAIGLAGELNQISIKTASAVGFIPFILYFQIIYRVFLPPENHTEQTRIKHGLYWYFVIVWGLYGVASFLPYTAKNSMYNILDVFAKNIYGLFLVAYILRFGQEKQDIVK